MLDINDALSAPDAPAEAPAEPVQETAPAAPEQEQLVAETGEPEAAEAEKPLPEIKFEDEATFSDEALQTPEQIRAARALVRDKRRENHTKYLELQKREKRFKADKAETLQLRDNFRAQFGALQNDIQALRQGDADTVLGALSRLSGGRNATELFEEISVNLARNGKRAPSAEVTELRSELEQLKNALTQRDTHSRVEAERRAILTEASNAEKYPIIADYAQSNPAGVAEDVAQYVLQEHRNGNPIDYPTALAYIESALRERFSKHVAAAPRAESEREIRAAEANPGAPQVGKTLAPSLATQSSGVVRTVSEAERLKKAANEMPADFWAQFGM